MCAAHSSVNMGENSSVLELLTCLNDHFVDMFCENYVEIFTHTKGEIVISLIKKDKEQLNLLRTRMLVHLVEQFPQFAGRGIVTRRKKSLLADDIYIIQIMTDHEGNRKIYLAQGIQEGLETVDYCPRRSRG